MLLLQGGITTTVSRRSRERRSVGPLLSTVRLGQPRADVLTSRVAIFGYERSGGDEEEGWGADEEA
jgi:hypothetical protein